MITCYLGLGSNLGDRESQMRMAVAMLAEDEACQLLRCSRLYETDPVGPPDQGAYLNAVIALATRHSAHTLLQCCQKIEIRLGRVRTRRWGPRVIDIDLLRYGNTAINEDDLILPHPQWHLRPFVLVPMADVVPPATHFFEEVSAALAKTGRTGIRACHDWDLARTDEQR